MRYGIDIKRPGQDGRTVAVGSREAMLAVARLYGGRDVFDRVDRSAGLVGCWDVENPFQRVSMYEHTDGWEGMDGYPAHKYWHRQALEKLPLEVQEREFWNKPIREAVEAGRMDPDYNTPYHCQLCGNETRETKDGMRFCKSCDDPVPANFMSRGDV